MSAKKSKFQGLFEDGQVEEEVAPPQQQAEQSTLPVEQEEVQKARSEEIKKSRKQDTGTDGMSRVKTNYEIREDYVRAFKVMAADEGRKIYQLLEEAMHDFLVKRGKITPD